MGTEMVIGLPIKKGEDIFKRDEDGKIIGKRNTEVTYKEEKPEDAAKRKKLHEEHIAGLHQKLRKPEYPEFGEFADMIYHSMTNRYDSLTPEEKVWYDKCSAVKKKYPPVK